MTSSAGTFLIAFREKIVCQKIVCKERAESSQLKLYLI